VRFLLSLLLLCSCLSSYVARPVDLITPGPIYCNYINQDVQDCRDGVGNLWRCDYLSGRWACYRVLDRDPNDIP